MRHASLSLAFTVVLLTIAMVGFAVRRLLVFVIGFTQLPLAGLLAAVVTAIAVATVTTATDIENGATAIATTTSLPKNNVSVRSDMPSHPHWIAGWTSGPPS
jgi:hypothetical protein